MQRLQVDRSWRPWHAILNWSFQLPLGLLHRVRVLENTAVEVRSVANVERAHNLYTQTSCPSLRASTEKAHLRNRAESGGTSTGVRHLFGHGISAATIEAWKLRDI